MIPLFRPVWCCARSCSFSKTRTLALGCFLPTATAVANPTIPPPMITYSCMGRIRVGELIGELAQGSVRFSEEHFPAAKSLGVTRGRGGLGGPQPHQTVKQFFREPLLILLRCKVTVQVFHFLSRVGVAQRHEKIR